MRTVVLFALALTGLTLAVADVAAGPFKRKHRSDCECGSAAAGPGYASPTTYGNYSPTGRYGYADTGAAGTAYAGAMGGYTGPYFNGGSYYVQGRDGQYYVTTAGAAGTAGQMTAGPMMAGRSATIQTTDGRMYALGADGSYYPASAGATTGLMGQPAYGSMNRGYSSFYPTNVYPAGYSNPMYPGSGVYPAGGTGPIMMPGASGIPAQVLPRK